MMPAGGKPLLGMLQSSYFAMPGAEWGLMETLLRRYWQLSDRLGVPDEGDLIRSVLAVAPITDGGPNP